MLNFMYTPQRKRKREREREEEEEEEEKKCGGFLKLAFRPYFFQTGLHPRLRKQMVLHHGRLQ